MAGCMLKVNIYIAGEQKQYYNFIERFHVLYFRQNWNSKELSHKTKKVWNFGLVFFPISST